MSAILIFGEIKRFSNVQIMLEYNNAINSKQQILMNAKESFVLRRMILDEESQVKDFEFIEVNKAFEEIVGIKKNNILGKRVLEIFPDTEKRWFSFFDRVLKENKQMKIIDYSRCLDKYFEVNAYPIDDNFIATLTSDVTNLVKQEKELEFAAIRFDKANKLKMQFLRDINHRLRTPLNGMMGMLQLIDIDDMGEENKKLFVSMSLEMRHNRNIINQIAKYVEIEEMEYQVTRCNLRMILEEQIEEKKSVGNQINLYIQEEETLELVFLEEKVFIIVFNEVLKNALKYTNNGIVDVRVSIETKGSDSTTVYKIKVKDYGFGIAKEKIDYIFNEFYHSDFINIYKEENRASLPMCKQMLKNNGGDIYVESEINIGTTFTIILPFFES
jgi:PAS domain S-box-containing protein